MKHKFDLRNFCSYVITLVQSSPGNSFVVLDKAVAFSTALRHRWILQTLQTTLDLKMFPFLLQYFQVWRLV